MATKNPYQGDDYDFFEAARGEDGGIKKEAPKAEAPKAEPKAEAPKKQSFAQAFAAARRAGDKTFMFNGKSFSTKLASDKPKAAATTVARTAAANMGRAGPTKARAAAMPAAPKAEAPKPKTEMQRNTASNAAANRERLEARAKANRERMEAQRKAREERKKKSEGSKSLFGRNPAGKTPAEVRKMAKGGSVKGAGIETRGMRKCKIV